MDADALPSSPLNPDPDSLNAGSNPTVDKPSTTVTGRQTSFGLNYDGSPDYGDKANTGFFTNPSTGTPWNSHDPNQRFASIPFSVFRSAIGNPYDPQVQKLVSNGAYKVRGAVSGKNFEFPLGDLGPAAWTGNALDLSGGAVAALGLKDNGRASYQVIGPDNKPVLFKGNLQVDPNAPIESGKTRNDYAQENLGRYMRYYNNVAPGLKVMLPEDVNKIDYIRSKGFQLYNAPIEDQLAYHIAKDPLYLTREENLPIFKAYVWDKRPGIMQQVQGAAARVGPGLKGILDSAAAYVHQIDTGNWANVAAINAQGMGQGTEDAVDMVDHIWTGMNQWRRGAEGAMSGDPKMQEALDLQNARDAQGYLARSFARQGWAKNVQNVASVAYSFLPGMEQYSQSVRSATPPQGAVDTAAMASNPLNYAPGVAGAVAGGAVKGMFFERAIDAAASAEKADNVATALRLGLGASDPSAIQASQVAGAAMGDSNRVWSAIDAMSREQGSAAGALLNVVSKTSGGAKRITDLLNSLPDKLAEKIAPGNVGAQKFVQGAMLEGAIHYSPPAAGVFAGSKALSPILGKISELTSLAGKELSLGESSVPILRRIAEQTKGWTRYTVGALDNPLVYSGISMTKGAVAGALTGAALNEVAAGRPDLGTALQGAGQGALYGMAGGGMGQWLKYSSPGQFMLEAAGDLRRFKSVLTQEQMQGFNRLSPSDKGMLAQYAAHVPGLRTYFEHDPQRPPGFQSVDQDGTPSVTINTASKTPLDGVIAHEIAHATVHDGNAPDIVDSILGNPNKGINPLYSNQEFQAMKQQYLDKLLASGRPISHLTDKNIALEIYAEHGVDYLKSGQGILDARSSFNPAISANPSALKTGLAKLGYVFDRDGNNVKGNNLFERMGASQDVYNLQKAYFTEKRKYDLSWNPEDAPDVIYRQKDLNASPGILERLKANPEIARDAKGNAIRDGQGNLTFIKPSQIDKVYNQLGNDIKKQISYLPQDIRDQMGHVVAENGSEHFNWVPQSVVDAIKGKGTYNPEQLKHLDMINAARMDPARHGQEFQFFYQPALKMGKYGSIEGQYRTWVPYGFNITKAGNMTINGVDFAKLANNYLKLQNIPDVKGRFSGVGEFMGAAQKYFENHVGGLPGETGLAPNLPAAVARKNIINRTLGLNTNEWAASNPLVRQFPKKTGSFILTPRLDRINTLQPTDVMRPWKGGAQYDLINRNYIPKVDIQENLKGKEDLQELHQDLKKIYKEIPDWNVPVKESQFFPDSAGHYNSYVGQFKGPGEIGINPDKTSIMNDRRLTFIHELMHAQDHQSFGDRFDLGSKYFNGFDKDKDIANFLSSVGGTYAMSKNKDLLARGGTAARYGEYLTSPQETAARAFTQHAVDKLPESKYADLKDYVERKIEGQKVYAHKVWWTKEEMRNVVSPAVERLMAAKGLKP